MIGEGGPARLKDKDMVGISGINRAPQGDDP
jgi:hypothetical protein